MGILHLPVIHPRSLQSMLHICRIHGTMGIISQGGSICPLTKFAVITNMTQKTKRSFMFDLHNYLQNEKHIEYYMKLCCSHPSLMPNALAIYRYRAVKNTENYLNNQSVAPECTRFLLGSGYSLFVFPFRVVYACIRICNRPLTFGSSFSRFS